MMRRAEKGKHAFSTHNIHLFIVYPTQLPHNIYYIFCYYIYAFYIFIAKARFRIVCLWLCRLGRVHVLLDRERRWRQPKQRPSSSSPAHSVCSGPKYEQKKSSRSKNNFFFGCRQIKHMYIFINPNIIYFIKYHKTLYNYILFFAAPLRWPPHIGNSTQKPCQRLLYYLYRFITTTFSIVHFPIAEKPYKSDFQNIMFSVRLL